MVLDGLGWSQRVSDGLRWSHLVSDGHVYKIFLSEILKDISVEKLNGFPFGSYMRYVLVFRLRRALSEAEEGVI